MLAQRIGSMDIARELYRQTILIEIIQILFKILLVLDGHFQPNQIHDEFNSTWHFITVKYNCEISRRVTMTSK